MLMTMISSAGLCWYANVIMDGVLIIYYGNMTDEVNVKMVNTLKVSPLRNYVKRPLPGNEDVVYFMLLDKTDKIKKFYEELYNQEFVEDLRIVTYESHDYPGYSYIKIYDKDANKENMLKSLMDMIDAKKTVTFGTIPDQYDVVIHEDDANEVVRRVRKMYEPFLYRK